METRKGIRWTLVSGAVELSWFFSWAMFCSLTTLHRPFPFFESLCAFSLAVFVTHHSTGRGWRIIWVLALKGLAFLGAALLVIHGLYYDSIPLLDGGWLTAFFARWWGATEWMILILNFLLILILWALGVTLAGRPKGYESACNRFDLGLAAFFALFILKLIVRIKGGALAEDSLSLLFVFPFFLFGLVAIGMARMQGTAAKTFLPGYRGAGVIASFFAIVLLGTGGLLLFFLPGLTAAAQVGYQALAIAGKPIGSVLVTILRFIFGARSNRPVEAAAAPDQPIDWSKITPETHSWWMELLEKILSWGIGGLLLFALLLVLAFALFYAVKWLLSRTAKSEGQRAPSRLAPFTALWAFVCSVCRKIMRGIRGYETAAELYGALLGWARRSGFPHDRRETPLEFGTRLNALFPALKPQITLIIRIYNREVYGETVLDDAPIAAANSAWQSLRSPLRWPARFRGWLGGTVPNGEET
jgi:hypothetical protein